MKVLICIPCLMTGGTEIQTLNLAQALVHGGHEVVTVCYFEYNKEMVSQYQEAGSRVICLNPAGTRITGKEGAIFLYKGLKRAIKECRPTIAHVQYMAPGAIPILLLRLLGMNKIIATAHTTADIYPSLKLVHFIQKHCVRVFTCITKQAEESFFKTSQLYTPDTILKNRNHLTLYNALPSYIQICKNGRTLSHPVTLGVISRLETIKGMDLVIPAFAQIRARHPEVRLMIVGDGSLKGYMQQQAKELQVDNDSVIWSGWQPQDKLQSLYKQIDIILMPSRSEGFGLTAIEAMAGGCVVVASNVGGLPEIVTDREIGLLHRTEDVEDIVQKTDMIISNKSLYRELSANAIRRVSKYQFENFSGLICDLYDRLNQNVQ